jgi:hypothetical protein
LAFAVKRFYGDRLENLGRIDTAPLGGPRVSFRHRVLVKASRPAILKAARDCRLATGARSKCGTPVVDVTFSPRSRSISAE